MLFNKGFVRVDLLKKSGFKKIGKNVRISKDCLIVGKENISLGSNIRIDSFTTIIVDQGNLTIGNNVHIGSHCHLLCSGGIKIGNQCTFSQGIKIYSQTDDYLGNYPAGIFNKNKNKYYTKSEVLIDDYNLIGSGTVILPGVKITKGCSIGALTLINKSIKNLGIYAGIPFKKIKSKKKFFIEKIK